MVPISFTTVAALQVLCEASAALLKKHGVKLPPAPDVGCFRSATGAQRRGCPALWVVLVGKRVQQGIPQKNLMLELKTWGIDSNSLKGGNWVVNPMLGNTGTVSPGASGPYWVAQILVWVAISM